MNERIQELAKQAGGNPNYSTFRGHFLPPPPDYIDPATVDLEKFAELIIRECIKVVDDTMTENQEMNIGLVMASAAIIAHFGVEE